jgi:hypothetical protein
MDSGGGFSSLRFSSDQGRRGRGRGPWSKDLTYRAAQPLYVVPAGTGQDVPHVQDRTRSSAVQWVVPNQSSRGGGIYIWRVYGQNRLTDDPPGWDGLTAAALWEWTGNGLDMD